MQGCSVQVGKRKGPVKFFEERSRKNVCLGYGEPKMEFGEVTVNVSC